MGEGKVPLRLKTEPVWPPWGLRDGFPGRNSHRTQLGRGCSRAGRARLTWAGPGSGVPNSCPDWAGRAQPGLIRAQSSASRSPGMGRWGRAPSPPPSSPLWTQCRGLFAASPGIWGSRRGLATQGGAGDPLEPGERDRDKSPLSPSLLAEFPALSWSISLGKRNYTLPQPPPPHSIFPEGAGEKSQETEARFGPGWRRNGKSNPRPFPKVWELLFPMADFLA